MGIFKDQRALLLNL